MGDITRNIFNPAKHYSGVRMQQGRVFLEHDANENEQICADHERRALRDIIGPTGTPNNGFQISFKEDTLAYESQPFENGAQSFVIQPGTYYLDGLRVEMENAEPFTEQSDWLAGPSKESAALTGSERIDLVYLEAWEQEVSAVEDDELFEKALGGPDTSTRMRIMHRVKRIDVGANRSEALETAKKTLAKQAEKARSVTLKVELEDTGGSVLNKNDLCRPYVATGYLDAENQAVRVQLLGGRCFTWGFDNASMLYRVTIERSDGKDVVSFVTKPRDEHHWPGDNQVVEILPFACKLVNDEAIAEITGHLTKVTQVTKDAATKQLVLADNIPADFPPSGGKRLGPRKPGGEEPAPQPYLFMRVWDRGDDTSQPARIPIHQAGNALGHTGLKVVFAGPDGLPPGGLPGDYWVIGVRPETPEVVVPQELRKQPTPPHGIGRHFAPLALIHWTKAANEVKGTIIYDLRDRFHPLTRKSTCCSCTVGDGLISHGDFDRLEDAVAFLGNHESGKICLLPGIHRTATRIDNRKDILIEGCGQRTLLAPPEKADKNDPLLTIADSTNITITDLEMFSPEGTAVVITGSGAASTRGIRIAHTRIIAGVAAIAADNVVDLTIAHNRLAVLDRPEGQRVLTVRAENCLIRRNTVLIAPAGQVVTPDMVEPGLTFDDPCFSIARMKPTTLMLYRYPKRFWPAAASAQATQYKALGGIHIRGGSRNITVCENTIAGGRADGVTIGETLPLSEPKYPVQLRERNTVTVAGPKDKSGIILRLTDKQTGEAVPIEPTDDAGQWVFPGRHGNYEVSVLDAEYTIAKIDVQTLDSRQSQFTVHVASAPELPQQGISPAMYVYDIAIERNNIQHMGLSGIGTRDMYFDNMNDRDLTSYLESGYVYGGVVSGLIIRENTIRQCLQNTFDEALTKLVGAKGLGGISLGLCENTIIQGNLIEDNGTSHADPVCGVYIGSGELLDIAHNRITNNGKVFRPLKARSESPGPGKRGGIVIDYAAVAVQMNPVGTPAVRIHDNIVDQPVGLALSITALGSVSVQANFFNAEFTAAQNRLNGIAGTVWIQNLAGFSGRVIDSLEASLRPETLAKTSDKYAYLLSLYTCAIMNITAHNQTDHGIRAEGLRQRVLAHNQILYEVLCTSTNNVVAETKESSAAGLAAFNRTREHEPCGNVILTGNQIRLGEESRSQSSVVVFSNDDAEISDNQIHALTNKNLLCTTVVRSFTLRACGNRISEPLKLNGARVQPYGVISTADLR